MARVLCVGAGHVGLPLSLKFWSVGHDVAVVDIDASKIEALQRGQMPFHEPGCGEMLEMAAGDCKFRPVLYSDPDFESLVRGADYVVMTLGTPLGTDYTFRFDQYFDVLERMVGHLRHGGTMVVRTPIAPPVTDNC